MTSRWAGRIPVDLPQYYMFGPLETMPFDAFFLSWTGRIELYEKVYAYIHIYINYSLSFL